MQMLPPLLFGVSASLDALLVGVTCGIRRVRISPWQNLLISFITLAGTCLSVGLGTRLLLVLPIHIATLAGSMVLILLGIYYIVKSMLQYLEKYQQRNIPQVGEIQQTSIEDYNNTLESKEALALGFALSANNVGIGLSASIAGLSLVPTAVVTLFFSLVFLFLGNRLGRCSLLRLMGNAADSLTGILLICLGLFQLSASI